jgi:hypothetical protein
MSYILRSALARHVHMNLKVLAIAGTAVILAGCGTIKNYEQLAQPTGKDLETYVGGSIFKVNRSRDLPNAFGRADLFGGKVFAGYTELRYQGVTDDGRVILRITELETHSTETTMSRYGQSSGSFSGYSDPSGNVHGNVTVHNPLQGSTEIMTPFGYSFSSHSRHTRIAKLRARQKADFYQSKDLDRL